MDQINYKKQQAQILVNLLETSKFEEAVLKGKPLIKKLICIAMLLKGYKFYKS